jgi:hypothetical protein
MLYRMCVNPSKHEFDILYEELMDTYDAIRAWLDAEPKEKWAFSYDYDGHHYGKLTMNLSEVFNNVLKTIRRLPILAIVQIIFLVVIFFFCGL